MTFSNQEFADRERRERKIEKLKEKIRKSSSANQRQRKGEGKNNQNFFSLPLARKMGEREEKKVEKEGRLKKRTV